MVLQVGVQGKRENLDAAFNSLRQYALASEDPLLLIVSALARFRIPTNSRSTTLPIQMGAVRVQAYEDTLDKFRGNRP